MTIKMIAAVSINGVIGITENGSGKIPWHYPEDMKFFREQTKGSTVIMGRATFQSIGKALPKRRNIVISKVGKGLGLLDNVEGIEVFNKLDDAVQSCQEDAWIIGGERMYQEGMKYADQICLTLIPEFVDVNYKKHAKFPWINPMQFSAPIYSSLSNELHVAYYNKK